MLHLPITFYYVEQGRNKCNIFERKVRKDIVITTGFEKTL